MKLFPRHPHPPPVKAWQVPISKTAFSEITDDTWDMTMRAVFQKMDGINTVSQIARLADVAMDLTKVALQHLLYYDSILMLDSFLFNHIYAPGPELNDFVADADGLQDECANYVYINGPRLPTFYLVRLFTSLCTGRTLKEWLKLHLDQDFPVLNYVDVRRFVQFGIIKGLIARVHKYAISAAQMAHLAAARLGPVPVPTTAATPTTPASPDPRTHAGALLQSYADGTQCFDQITAEKHLGDVAIMDLLRKFPKGDVEIVYR
jgi:hypothetical protein